jgi:hypothetical protein
MSIPRSKSGYPTPPMHYLRLNYMLSLTNGVVSGKLADYVQRLGVCLANSHHTTSQHSNGGLLHLSHIT